MIDLVCDIIAGAAVFFTGLVVGLIFARAFLRWRSEAWIRSRCASTAADLAKYLGNPVILRSVAARSAEGHRYDTDRAFVRTLRESLDRGFDPEA